MNLIQQGRYFLYFIKHNPAFRGPVAHKGFEAVRVTRKLKKKGSIKQVKAQGMRQNLLEPGTPIWAIKNASLSSILFASLPAVLLEGLTVIDSLFTYLRTCPPLLWRTSPSSGVPLDT
jgi:hypothetical protein